MDAESFRRHVDALDHAALLLVVADMIGPELRLRVAPEDVVQTTLERACRDHAQHTFVDPRSFRAWLIQIARHAICDIADHLRAGKRGGGRPQASLDESGMSHLHPLVSSTPSRIAMEKERATAMEDALAALPPELSTLVRGHLFGQRTMAELAAEQEINLATAWSRFRRGAALFRQALARWQTTATSTP